MLAQNSPVSSEDQAAFVRFYFKYGGIENINALDDMLKKASAKELRGLVVDGVNGLLEMLDGNEAYANELMHKNGLPGFSKFKLLNTRPISSILKKDAIATADDAMFIRDAIEGGLIRGEKLDIARRLMQAWT